MSLDPVTAGLDAVADIATALTPVIANKESQQYVNDYTQYITQYNEIMAATPVDLNAVNTYLMQLASRSGKAFGSLGNEDRSCPVEYFDWLIERANFCNELVQVNASLQAKLTSGSN